MKASTIRGIRSILSGAFAAAQRWEWTDRNPAESAKPPTTTRQPIPATSPDDVAKVVAEARSRSAALGLYLWLVVVTGVRHLGQFSAQRCHQRGQHLMRRWLPFTGHTRTLRAASVRASPLVLIGAIIVLRTSSN